MPEIYWHIKNPNTSWRVWSDGVSDNVDEAKVDAMLSVLDDDNQLLPWAKGGVSVQMWRLTDIEDFKIDESNAETFRKNYLGIKDG